MITMRCPFALINEFLPIDQVIESTSLRVFMLLLVLA
jgi:hypothetical protein